MIDSTPACGQGASRWLAPVTTDLRSRRSGAGGGIEQHKDRGRVDIGNIGPTEDAVMRRFSAAAPSRRPSPRIGRSDVRGRGINQLGQYAVHPPSTIRFAPLTYVASLARKATAAATSSARPSRENGVRDWTYANPSSVALRSPGVPVTILPGATALQMIPRGP